MPDGHIIYSYNTALLPQNTLPTEARQAHIFPDLKNKALLSIGMFCDNGCLAIFDDKKVYIINKRTNNKIIHATRDNKSTLYMVPLTPEQNEDMTECKIPERHFSGSLYETKSKADLSTFLHLVCWIPCKSAMLTAIKKNFLSTWPGITEQLVLKFLPKSEATSKGHIRQSFKGKQSTRPKGPSEMPSQNPTRTHSVFLQATDLAGKN